MSNRLFSFTGAVTHCGPRKVRRTWLSTVVNVLVLLALAALCGWLWSCVRHASGLSHGAMSGGVLLAVMPIPEGLPDIPGWLGGCIVGLLAFGTVAGVWLVARLMSGGSLESRLQREHAESYWRAMEEDEMSEAPHFGQSVELPDTRKCEQRTPEDPLSAPYLGLDAADVKRILDAVVVECCTVEDLVRKAEANLSVEDYGERLAGARHTLKGMKLCLAQLAARFVPSTPDTLKREQRTPMEEAA